MFLKYPTFYQFVESGKLLRKICARKEEIKRIEYLKFAYTFGVSPTFDFNSEIANDKDLNSLYFDLENLLTASK